MPELNFKITGDDSELKKTLANIAKVAKENGDKISKEVLKITDTEVKSREKATKATQDQKKASDEVVKAVLSEAKAQDKVTEAIKRKSDAFDANGRQLRPFTFSNTQDEVDAANIGRVGTIPSGTVVGPGLDYNKLANEASSYGQAVKQAYNAAVTGATATVKSNEDIRKAIRDLQIQTQSYKGVAEKATDLEVLAKYNKKIVETQAEIARLRNVGKAGFDELGNKLTVTAGKMEILNKKLQVYREGLMRAQAPQSFVNLNRKIQDTEIQLNQLKNAGRTGFDELGNAIAKSGKVLSGLWAGLRTVANILPGIGIAGLIAFASEPIIEYVKNLAIFKKSLKDSAAEAASTSNQYKEAVGDVSSIKVAIEEYHSGVVKGSQVVKIYNDTIGKTAGTLKTVTEVEQFYNSKAGAFVEAMFLRAQAAAALEDATDKASEAQKRAMGSNTIMDYVGATGDAITAMLTFRGNIVGGFKDALDVFKKKDVDELTKKSKESLNVFEELKKKSDKFNKDNGLNLDAPKPDKSINAIISQQQSLQKRIDDINKEYARKSLTRDEEELQAVRDKFKKIADEAAKFNENEAAKLKANSKYKVHLVDTSKLEETKNNAITDLTYRQQTDKAKIELDKQKGLYADYEDYKTSLGKTAADERFKNEINTTVSLLQKLEADRANLLDKDPTQMTGAELERLHDYDKRIQDEINAEKKKYDVLAKQFITYNNQRKVLTEKYEADQAVLEGNSSAQTARTIAYKEDLKNLDESQIKKWDSYKALFEHLEDLNRKELASRIKVLQEKIKAELAAGNITADQAKKVSREISEIGRTRDNAGLELVLQRLQSIGNEISSINNDMGSIVGSLIGAASAYLSISKDLKTINDVTASQEERTAAKVGLYAQAANGLLSTITGITNAAAERKRVTEEFYKSAIDFQNQYNLSLIEQARLESVNKRGLFSKDSVSEIKDGLKASGMAMTEFQKKLDDLSKGQAKVGLRNSVDWKSTGSMVAGGIGAGAAIGSIVPGIGTVIGAAVGGVVGFIGGLFGTKKKKDTYAGLLTEFPELILKSADGTRLLNTGLAQQLIAQNQVNDATKQYLQAAIDAEKELATAREQVNEGIKTLVGSIDDDLRNALVDAFRAGEDGMLAFEKTVARSMENVISNLAFQAIFNDAFQELEDNMKASFGIGGDGSIVDDLESFYKMYGSLTKEFDQALKAAKEEAAKQGIELFGDSESSLSKNIKQITSEQASSLEGINRGQYEYLKLINGNQVSGNNIAQQTLDISMQHLRFAEQTAQNTGNTVLELKNAVGELKTISKNTASGSLRGAGLA